MTAPAVEEVVDDRYHISAFVNGLELRRVLKHGELFVVVSRTGNIRSGGRGEQGLYYRGTRHVSRLVLRLAGHLPLLLGSNVHEDDLLLTCDLTNPDILVCDSGSARDGHLEIPFGTLHVSRWSVPLDGVYLERIVVSNYGLEALEVVLSLELQADFADVFEVRGTPREQRGRRLPPDVGPTTVQLGYCGRDGVLRRTRFELEPPPTGLHASEASYRMHLPPHGDFTVMLRVVAEHGAELDRSSAAVAKRFDDVLRQRRQAIEEARNRQCRIWTSHERFNHVLERARADLAMLQTQTPQGPYPYAGIPWYSTPFGRDGLWTAMQMLWLVPEIGAGALEFLSAHQATGEDPQADAEPGKIVHEMRDGEMAALREVPFGCYYGSIDSTSLYLMLAWRHLEATNDRALMQQLWPHLRHAMHWIETYGDQDGDGFVEYGRKSTDGLAQQGWKDSNDSVFHRDGSLATGTIALCEVQGYVYDARLGMSMVAKALGHEPLAARWEREARALRERFDQAFWCEELGTYALALDGDKHPCRVRTSNAGHCLFTDIALPRRRAALARTLMHESMFSGFGIRTLASDERRYNPISYHNGSVWPHDTGIVARGLANAGFVSEAERLLNALFEVASASELLRLPELICGFARHAGRAPIQYPVACSPQAWASGSIFMALQAVLGLHVDGMARRITFNKPRLPPYVETLRIVDLRVGRERVSLRLHRHPEDVGILVTDATGDVEVVVVK
ncbi:amylo-alpha-1,6-glucosidase [Paraliomyxa miuraensis]|uniref:amylo-alpha-1,6-glucosidase n=1 Tax=Paraliomyxa miuraensis TaxID=376150 RepID=UPI00224F593B|nr:glycogen debranching N-terminal domain-containing protein [Paraliomyxa miuraensis]MCX4245477.1 hypothetical protein [Paraliomyxa miuraensis]